MFRDPSFPKAPNVTKTANLEPESNRLSLYKNSQNRKSVCVHNGILYRQIKKRHNKSHNIQATNLCLWYVLGSYNSLY